MNQHNDYQHVGTQRPKGYIVNQSPSLDSDFTESPPQKANEPESAITEFPPTNRSSLLIDRRVSVMRQTTLYQAAKAVFKADEHDKQFKPIKKKKSDNIAISQAKQ